MSDIQVMPRNDLREHISSIDCWCEPLRDDVCPSVIVHNSMDRREILELLEQIYWTMKDDMPVALRSECFDVLDRCGVNV